MNKAIKIIAIIIFFPLVLLLGMLVGTAELIDALFYEPFNN